MDKKELPRIAGKLRSKYLEMPEEIYKAKGIVIMGKRIKSVIFTTDIAIIRSCNADAVLAVYPFTPQQVISQSIINVAPMPVFVGVGGGITNGVRSAIIAKDAEGDGAFGVVVNAPMTNENITMIDAAVDIPIIATVINEHADIQARLEAGVSILNVSAASRTPEVRFARTFRLFRLSQPAGLRPKASSKPSKRGQTASAIRRRQLRKFLLTS